MIKNKFACDGNTIYIYVESEKYGTKEVLIDTEDMYKLKHKRVYVWGTRRHNSLYAIVQIENGKNCRLHRYLLKPKAKQLIDHKNGDGLDNRRSNLRITNSIGNNSNASKRKTSRHSKYKGVHFHKASNKWKAQIQSNKVKRHLGTFDTELEAAKAYNKAAMNYHGEYAKLNELKTK